MLLLRSLPEMAQVFALVLPRCCHRKRMSSDGSLKMPKLTKKVVEAAAPKDRHYYIFDEELPGFGVRVLTSGRKSFLVQHRVGGRGGETRRLALGMFGVVTVEEARKRAIAILGQRAAGSDPIREMRETAKQAMTVTVV